MPLDHIPIIVAAHAEDAATLWALRDRAVNAPDYSDLYLKRLDERVDAAVDGLAVNGEAGWAAALAAFEDTPEPGEMFALAALAFGTDGESGRDARAAAHTAYVMEQILAAPDQHVRPAISALGWLAPRVLRGKIGALLDDKRPVVRLLGLGACSVHRVDPGDHLERFLRDAPAVRARALRLAGEVGRADLLDKVIAQRGDDDASCTFWAAWSGTLLGERATCPEALLKVAGSAAAADMPTDEDEAQTHLAHIYRAFDPGVRAVDAPVVTAFLKALPASFATTLGVRAAGLRGDPAMIPWLLARMEDTAHARHAGESFSMLTGADLIELDLDGEPPADAPQGPNDDPDDTAVALDPDDDLPWPAPPAVAAWWKGQSQMQKHPSLFYGRPVGEESYRRAFAEGYQRQRRAAAFGLALASPTARLPNWRIRTI